MKTRETIEAHSSGQSRASKPKYAPGQNPNSRANLVKAWTPETAPKSGGRPKRDMSQIIARAVIEENAEGIYKAYARQLLKGGAFAFQVIAERGFGKLKETRDTGADFNEIPDSSLEERVTQLERELYPAVYPGLAREAGEAARAGSAAARDAAPALQAKDS